MVAILLIPKNELEPGDRVSLFGSEPMFVERLPVVVRREGSQGLVIKDDVLERRIRLADVECVVRIGRPIRRLFRMPACGSKRRSGKFGRRIEIHVATPKLIDDAFAAVQTAK